MQGDKTEVLAELDKRTSSLKALELEEEARGTLAQEMGQQLSSSNGEEVRASQT